MSAQPSEMTTPDSNMNHLQSEVTHWEAMTLFAHVQTFSEHFCGFTNEEIDILAARMSIMSFEYGDPIISEGEVGCWFGLLLRGTVRVELADSSIEVTRQAGDILGEVRPAKYLQSSTSPAYRNHHPRVADGHLPTGRTTEGDHHRSQEGPY